MSFEWQETTLGAICNAQGGSIQTGPFGSQLHTSDYKELGIPVVMPTNIDDGGITTDGIARIDQLDAERLQQHKLQLGDIVFSRRGDVTKNALVRHHETGWLCGTGCLKVRLGKQIIADSKFISYYLRLPDTKAWLVRHAVGATMPNLNTSILSAVPIRLPPLNVQLEVASLLGALDDRIAQLRETNATMETIAGALFKSWFVDFDPVHAKANGQLPEGIDAATAALFPDCFEDSGLGMTPKGWRNSTVGQSFILTMGQSPPGDTYNENGEGLPFYQGRTDFGFRFPKRRVFCTEPTRTAEAGDTLVSVRAPVGDVNVALEPCALGRGVSGLRHPNGYKSFVFYAARCLRPYFGIYDGEGTVFGSISKKDFQSLPVVNPTDDVLMAFNEIASSLDAAIENNEQTLRSLIEIREALLPKLMSRQLQSPNV